jgi:hypothetical protein
MDVRQRRDKGFILVSRAASTRVQATVLCPSHTFLMFQRQKKYWNQTLSKTFTQMGLCANAHRKTAIVSTLISIYLSIRENEHYTIIEPLQQV